LNEDLSFIKNQKHKKREEEREREEWKVGKERGHTRIRHIIQCIFGFFLFSLSLFTSKYS